MPSWTSKDERRYEHIKKSSRKRGASNRRAKEIAARTVNETRRRAGKTPKRTTSGTGNPTDTLEDRSKQELYNRARDLHVHGCSGMSKSDLAREIRKRQ